LGIYGGAMETAVRKLKYSTRSDLARPLGKALLKPWMELGVETDLLVPVPLHPRRLRERGYNQAALLASSLGAVIQNPCRPRALRRTRETCALPGLDREARSTQLNGAIAARRALPGLRVVLVDDVVTSGATILACRSALEDAGAHLVGVVALARAELTQLSGLARSDRSRAG
jgi:ComF family protein